MNAPLLDEPRVVATVTRRSDLAPARQAGASEADVLEFRIDELRGCLDETGEALAAARLPVLVTVRRREEGGAGELSDEERLALYERFLPEAALVDVETASLEAPVFEEFAGRVAESGAIPVASFHDFRAWPGRERIAREMDRAHDAGAQVAKVAVVLETLPQMFELAALVQERRAAGRLVSAMGMGPSGRLSRLVLAKAGSCLNYGYLREANAPGQWPAAELRRLLREL